jgi:hypothetical protein
MFLFSQYLQIFRSIIKGITIYVVYIFSNSIINKIIYYNFMNKEFFILFKLFYYSFVRRWVLKPIFSTK